MRRVDPSYVCDDEHVSEAARPAARWVDRSLLVGLVVTVAAGAALGATARAGAVPLLIVIVVTQAVFAVAWVFGTAMPGRWGGIVLAGAAATAADVSVSVWPHGRLGVLAGVIGLAIPAMFVHQLTRGAARVRLVASLSAIAVLLLAEVSLAALPQLRHEFVDAEHGGQVVAAAVLAVAAALAGGYVVDLIAPTPRFDPDVARGIPAFVVSVALGALVGFLALRDVAGFVGGRAALVGLVLGALAGLLAVAAAFVAAEAPQPHPVAGTVAGHGDGTGVGWILRPVFAALFPFAVAAPVAFLVCLAIRA